MGFRVGAYAKVWSIEPKSDTWTKLRISISRKKKDSEEYVYEYSGFVDVSGTVPAARAAKLSEGDRIRLGEVDDMCSYDKEKGVERNYRKIFSFFTEKDAEFEMKYPELLRSLAGNASNSSASAAKQKKHNSKEEVGSGDVDAPDLPF